VKGVVKVDSENIYFFTNTKYLIFQKKECNICMGIRIIRRNNVLSDYIQNVSGLANKNMYVYDE